MGMYTEFVMAARLNKDTPKDVTDILNYMINKRPDRPDKLPDHPLFDTERWKVMLVSDSAYFAGDSMSTLIRRNYAVLGEQYSLTVRSNLKNYDAEIEWFLDWISPYIDPSYNGCIGYMRYEEYDDPTLIYFYPYALSHKIQLLAVIEVDDCRKRPLTKFLPNRA